jgi:hypothetical protein
MTTTPPPLDFQHLPGYEIPTKHKEAIRQLHWFGHVPVSLIMVRYRLGETSVRRILSYDYPERRRPNRTGPTFLLSDAKVDEIINYLSESWEHRILKYDVLHAELELKCSVSTLERRLKQRGYFRCTACQKPYLTKAQVIARYLWAMAHIFWHTEWLKVLWSDEVTFLIGGRTAKEKVTRKRGERQCETCIQHQFHRGGTVPVNAWGAIGYGYKSPLLFLHGSGKKGAFTQRDYLSQILAPYIEGIVHAFALITHLLCPSMEPLFMEDGNSAHGHKSTSNCCAKWRTNHGIILMPHPSTSPDMNPIEKCWRRIKQSLHRRKHQPTTVAQMEQAVTEEWDAIPQEWINQLVLKHEHWVHVLAERRGWSTPN